MAENIVAALTQKQTKFSMQTTELMAINGGDVTKWAVGVHAVSRLPGWTKHAQVLIWVDSGNAWHAAANTSRVNGRVREYSSLAAAMSKNWEYIFYIIAGRKWDSLSTPSDRTMHGLIIDELEQHTKHIVFIDDLSNRSTGATPRARPAQ